jgi:hypothetical protein
VTLLPLRSSPRAASAPASEGVELVAVAVYVAGAVRVKDLVQVCGILVHMVGKTVAIDVVAVDLGVPRRRRWPE